jgi:hypothetical protein
MTTHSFGYRQDASQNNTRIAINDDRWRGDVPLRLPDTVCLQERLPAGAAGVPLNRSHPFHDLLLVITPQVKRMFDAIDERRSVRDIINHVGDRRSSDARVFFAKLWRYDQVVFNTSTIA